MAHRFSVPRGLLAGIAFAASLLGVGAAIAQPVYKDLERFGARPDVVSRPLMVVPPAIVLDPADAMGRPHRLMTGGPGYVGSDYGLGKPSFTGLGSRPDWGR